MARSSWNPSSPDIVGIEFTGVGGATNIIYSKDNWHVLKFTAQRTGEVDEIGLYSGVNTVNPVLDTQRWFGHRAPYIVELYKLADFGYAATHTITTYTSTITASSGVVNQTGGAPSGNELAQPWDDAFLVQSPNSSASATVHMPSANAFPLDQHVQSVAIEHNFLRQMRVRRLDSNGNTVYNRILPSGNTNWHMGEAYLDASSTASWRLWSPSDIRQFSSTGGGLRRLKVESLSKTQPQIIDLLRIHVDHVEERRVGVGVFEPSVINGWTSIPFHAPNVTGAAQINAGTEYALVIRTPYGNTDYQTLTRLDLRSIFDRQTYSGFPVYIPFTGLAWTLHLAETYSEGTLAGLGIETGGQVAIRLINNGAQTVDTQPYERTIGFRVYSGQDASQDDLPRPSPSIEYGQVQFVCSIDLNPTADLTVTIQNTATVTVTADEVQASPRVGADEMKNLYHLVTKSLGGGFPIGADPFDVTFSSETPSTNPWLISALAARTSPGTGDQTFSAGSVGSGRAIDPNTGLVTSAYGREDIQVSLISQPAEITGLAATVEQQALSGDPGLCEPCGPSGPLTCQVEAIPYVHLCWDPATTPLDQFTHYEVQRKEGLAGDWETVAVIEPEDVEASDPARGAGVHTTQSALSHVAPAVESFTNHDLLICAWQSSGFTGNYTLPGGMTADAETDGNDSTLRSGHQNVTSLGSTGPKTATFSTSDDYSAVSAVIKGAGVSSPVVQEVLSGLDTGPTPVTLTSGVGTQVGWWLVAVQGWAADEDDQLGPPTTGSGWFQVADSGFHDGVDASRTVVYARRVTTAGAQSVTFAAPSYLFQPDNHCRLYVLSNVDTPTAADAAASCWDDWTGRFDTGLCYRVRQQRVDGAESDWSTEICTTMDAPVGADLIVTIPSDPSLNAAFPEAHTEDPPTREWELMDADQVSTRAMYGRDGVVAFRPLERLGKRFKRRLLLSALCTTFDEPSLDVVKALEDIMAAGANYLVVRTTGRDRFYATLTIDHLLQVVDRQLGDIWYGDVEVTEVSTPDFTGSSMTGSHG